MDYTEVDTLVMDNDEDGKNGILVKTIIGIIGSLVVVGLVGVCSCLISLSRDISNSTQQTAVLTTKFDAFLVQYGAEKLALQQQINEAKGNTADKYTASAAAADFRSRDTQ